VESPPTRSSRKQRANTSAADPSGNGGNHFMPRGRSVTIKCRSSSGRVIRSFRSRIILD
jgi:hypothetical protein